ncbi:hypothetical protein JOF47_000656 [Paeniglutamicibacter kerguelensis]|uniref:Uncharacterized protein n=1 Tax=Paeniglutamicibacter kerguelensis TaxID=254788 RepID=A0ABS4X9K4_9MICC|nr:hypothetical protein [Paeniglutamicibacter kerguelensis]
MQPSTASGETPGGIKNGDGMAIRVFKHPALQLYLVHHLAASDARALRLLLH